MPCTGVGARTPQCATGLAGAAPPGGVKGRPLGRPSPDWVLPGTFSCAVVRCVLCTLPGFAAPGGRFRLAPVPVQWFWPVRCLAGVPCGLALVRRAWSGPVALGSPVGFTDAVVPSPTRGFRPQISLAAVRCSWRLAENRGHGACCWSPPRQGRWAGSASYRFGAPLWGCCWLDPPASVSGCVRYGGLACMDPARAYLWLRGELDGA